MDHFKEVKLLILLSSWLRIMFIIPSKYDSIMPLSISNIRDEHPLFDIWLVF